MFPKDQKRFLEELRFILNCHSIDNTLNTPDFILAENILHYLTGLHELDSKVDKWFGSGEVPVQLEGELKPECNDCGDCDNSSPCTLDKVYSESSECCGSCSDCGKCEPDHAPMMPNEMPKLHSMKDEEWLDASLGTPKPHWEFDYPNGLFTAEYNGYTAEVLLPHSGASYKWSVTSGGTFVTGYKYSVYEAKEVAWETLLYYAKP